MKRLKLATGLCLLALLVANIASAGPKAGWYRAYYDEAGVQVGARGWDCDLQSIAWGVVTERHYTTNICLME
ncbi:DUF6289 family protein [Luteimonas sp. R10]|uniref:DUF6289 family protein n=1 Tax=Luteimonas sp. R10 TaxID=3108176 RepID=UPI00308D9A9F|nr:DUF6289 family protein [Luteimonas sp. R10]